MVKVSQAVGRPRNFDEHAVVQQAVTTFWKHGAANTTIRVLESELGLKSASIYNTFGTKQELLHRALQNYLELVAENLLVPLGAPGASSDELVQFIDDVVDWVTNTDHPGCLMLNVLGEQAHGDESMTARQRVALVAALLAIMSVPGVVSSQSTDDEATPDYSRKGADTCFACHDDQTSLAIFRTKHAVPDDSRSQFGHDQLQCESCHGPAGDHSGRVRRGQERPPVIAFGKNAAGAIADQNNNCINCHSMPPQNGAPMSLISYQNVKNAVQNRGLIQLISTQDLGDVMPLGGPLLPHGNFTPAARQFASSGSLQVSQHRGVAVH